MNYRRRFKDETEHFLNSALARPGMELDTCAKNIAKRLEKINDSQEEQERITQYTQDSKIKDLVHFTRVENLKGILECGLIPRYYLEEKKSLPSPPKTRII